MHNLHAGVTSDVLQTSAVLDAEEGVTLLLLQHLAEPYRGCGLPAVVFSS